MTSTEIHTDVTPTSRSSPRRSAFKGTGEVAWIGAATVGVFVASAMVAPGTLSSAAVLAMLPFAAVLAIVGIGQTLVIQQRGLDMAVGGALSASGLLIGFLSARGVPIGLALMITVVALGLSGCVSGFLTVILGITPLVATLAVDALLLGACSALSGGSTVSMPDSLIEFTRGRHLGLPSSVWVAALLVAGSYAFVRLTIVGRRFVAVGASPPAARTAGLAYIRYQVATYVASAACACVAGVLLAGYIGSASSASGGTYLLASVAAVVVGGTPFSGGRGSILATGIAALFLSQLGQMVLGLGAPPAAQLLVQALVIVLATGVRLIRWRGLLSVCQSLFARGSPT